MSAGQGGRNDTAKEEPYADNFDFLITFCRRITISNTVTYRLLAGLASPIFSICGVSISNE